jgi:hypothetical protein
MKRPKTLIIEGRRWFQKSYGNTYHTVYVTDENGRMVAQTESFTYGYGDHYLQTAEELVRKALDLKEPTRHEWGVSYLRKQGFTVHYHVKDVPRQRDL